MTNGVKPNYKGTIQTDYKTKVGKIALWDNLEPTKENSPLQTGTIEIEIPEINGKRTYRVSVWKNVPKDQ
jgi:hypothetical protein